MKPRELIFEPQAIKDLADIHDWIANRASSAVAMRYVDRIETYLEKLTFALSEAPSATISAPACARSAIASA